MRLFRGAKVRGPIENQTRARSKPEIQSVLIASTGHVTREEAATLDSAGYGRGEYGWLVALPEGNTAIPEISPLSDGLRDVLKTARDHACHFVLFDRDADELEDVATYEW